MTNQILIINLFFYFNYEKFVEKIKKALPKIQIFFIK